MALTSEDLQFKLVADVETGSLKVIKELGKQINVTWEAQLGILDRAFQKLSDQQGKLVEMKMLQDPTILRETVRIRMEQEEQLRKQLDTMKEIEKTMPIEVLDVRKRADEMRLDSLKAQREQLEKIRALMEPDFMERSVKLQIQQEKAEEHMEKMRNRERERQGRITTVGGLFASFTSRGIGGTLRHLMGGNPPEGGGAGGGIFSGAKEKMAGAKLSDLTSVRALLGVLVGKEVLEGISQVASTMGKLAAAPFKTITGGLHMVSSGLHELQGGLGPFGAAASMMSGAIGMVGQLVTLIPVIGEVLGPVIMALAPIPKVMADITQSLVNMTRVSSPATFKLWEYALTDLQGVIGRAFTPVLVMMTHTLRKFADLVATVMPTAKEMEIIFRPLLDSFNQFISLLQGHKELVHDLLVVSLTLLMGVMMTFVGTTTLLTRSMFAMLMPFEQLLKLMRRMGILGPVDDKSSYGAAARPASLGSLESYQNKLIESAFSVPGEKVDPAASTLPYLSKMNDLLQGILDGILGGRLTGVGANAAGGFLNGLDAFGIGRAIAGFRGG